MAITVPIIESLSDWGKAYYRAKELPYPGEECAK